MEQWAGISSALKAKSITPFLDCAYQGFASGNADTDAAALRMFVEDGHSVMLAQSYAKNFGLSVPIDTLFRAVLVPGQALKGRRRVCAGTASVSAACRWCARRPRRRARCCRS